jgi:predicted nucleotidyltransferase
VTSVLVERAARAYHARLDDELPGRVRRVVLFGSWARGEAHEESDVDIFVLLARDATPRECAHAIDIGAAIGFEHRLPFAPLVLSERAWDEMVRRERLLPREIERDGVDA